LLLGRFLKYLPKAVLFGVFLYMGVTSITGNQLFERIFLWGIFDPKKYPRQRYVTRVSFWQLHKFTAIQFACLVILYVLKSIKQTAVVFPFFIGFLVFVRKWLARFFSKDELAVLDAHLDLPPDPVEPMAPAVEPTAEGLPVKRERSGSGVKFTRERSGSIDPKETSTSGNDQVQEKVIVTV
jgi:hypothetical protein